MRGIAAEIESDFGIVAKVEVDKNGSPILKNGSPILIVGDYAKIHAVLIWGNTGSEWYYDG
jgi:hypothetical protein